MFKTITKNAVQPYELKKLLNKRAKKLINAGDIIKWEIQSSFHNTYNESLTIQKVIKSINKFGKAIVIDDAN